MTDEPAELSPAEAERYARRAAAWDTSLTADEQAERFRQMLAAERELAELESADLIEAAPSGAVNLDPKGGANHDH